MSSAQNQTTCMCVFVFAVQGSLTEVWIMTLDILFRVSFFFLPHMFFTNIQTSFDKNL